MFKLLTDDLRKAVSTAIAESRGFDLKDDLFTYELRLMATESIAKNRWAYIVVSDKDGIRSINVYPYFSDVLAVKDHEKLVSVFEIKADEGVYKVNDGSWLC